MTLRENMRELLLKECQVVDQKLSSSQNQEESLNELVLRIIQGIFKYEQVKLYGIRPWWVKKALQLRMFMLCILFVIVQMT